MNLLGEARCLVSKGWSLSKTSLDLNMQWALSCSQPCSSGLRHVIASLGLSLLVCKKVE